MNEFLSQFVVVSGRVCAKMNVWFRSCVCRAEWETGAMFVTPPGWWHSHHNESAEEAWVLPVQDAGLYTHQRTLDIRFAEEEVRLHREGLIR